MEHETTYVNVDGISVLCMAKIIGDHFRYFVDHYEFPFCSIDKPNEQGKYLARTCGGRRLFDNEFCHENVIQWALKTIKEDSMDYYKLIVKS